MSSDWTGLITARHMTKAALFEMYDAAIKGGFDDEETRMLVKGGLDVAERPELWPLFELWLDRERPIMEVK